MPLRRAGRIQALQVGRHRIELLVVDEKEQFVLQDRAAQREALGLLLEPLVDRGPGREPLWHIACFVLEIEDDAVGDTFVKLIGVDVGAEDIPRHQLVLAQERSAGEADEDRAL